MPVDIVKSRNPFAKTIPDAVTKNSCGVCGEAKLRKHFECRSLDSGFAPLYVCVNCLCVYNATAEFNVLDVVEWQKRWADDPEFYNVSNEESFFQKINDSRGVFEFFQRDLERSFSGTYTEIGAGSGIMAAAALNYFSSVNVFDHVTTRLEEVKARVGSRYNVVTVEKLKKIETDVVLIWHAMEHFLNPGGVFELCANMLRENGLMLLQVPILSEEHVYPGHYYFYNETTFNMLADRYKFANVKFYYDHSMNAMTVALTKC